MKTNQNTIEYNGMLISFDESQTVGNCIDLGISTELTKQIILEMRKNNISYLSKRELEKYRK